MIGLSRFTGSQPLTPDVTLRIGHPPRAPRRHRWGWPENASEIALNTMLGISLFTGAIT